MGAELEFWNYNDKPNELVGKLVMIKNYGKHSFANIESITKTTFKAGGIKFNISNCNKRGDGTYSTNYCKLTTEENMNKLKSEWAIASEIRVLRDIIKNNCDKLPLEKLKLISDIINS